MQDTDELQRAGIGLLCPNSLLRIAKCIDEIAAGVEGRGPLKLLNGSHGGKP